MSLLTSGIARPVAFTLPYFLRALVFVVLANGSAYAEQIGNSGDSWRLKLNADFSAPGSHSPREDHHLYRVDFVCKAKAMPLPQDRIFDLVALRSVTTTHSLVISRDYIPADATGKLKIPEKPLRLLTPYSMNGSNVSDNRKICPQDPLVISGTQPVYLVGVVSYSTTNSPGVIVKIGYQIAKLITPLWSIFQPEVIPALIGRKIASVGETEEPLKDILSTFNKDESFGKGFNLDVGRYVISTDYSEVVITVSGLTSVVKAKPSSLQETFRAQLKTAPEQIKSDSVGTTCVDITTALKEAGFSENEDVPYALVYLSSKLSNKSKMLECLRATDSVTSALGLGPVLWAWIPRVLVLTKEYVDGVQPSSFAEAKPRIYNFIVALSRITKGDPARAAEGLSQLKLIIPEKIKLTDSVDNYLGGSSDLGPSDFAQRFVDRKYLRFGCMAPVGEKNGLGLSNGIGSFLVIKASADATEASLSDVLPVHVIFKGGLVSEIIAFQEAAWAKNNLDANEGNCNGFKLKGVANAARSGTVLASDLH
jgi:hypothetical protein